MRKLALFTATAISLGSLSVPLSVPAAFAADSFPASAPAAPTVESGHLTWPIKRSFIGYLAKPFAHGTIDVSEGATQVGQEFMFPIDAGKTTIDSQGNGTIDTQGALHFLAHPKLGPNGTYGLDISISDVKVEVKGKSATITADYKVSGAAGPGSTEPLNLMGDDVAISTFELAEALKPTAGKAYSTVDTKTSLTPEASKMLLGMYPAGPLDDGNTDLAVTFADSPNIGDDDAQTPGPTASPAAGSSTGAQAGIGAAIAAIVALLAAIGAAASGIIPGLNLPKLF